MSLLSLSPGAKLREDHFLGDLTSLFRRHDVPTGTPDCLLPLASRLNESRSMRSDLYMLCSAISRMSASDLTPDEQLHLVARAATGSRDTAIPEELRAAFLPGLQEWASRAVSTQGRHHEFQPEQNSAPTKAPPRISRFSAAAARSRGDAAPSTSAAVPREIRPDTPIGDLTISQLREYIDDIEQRMGRLQPYLATLNTETPQSAPPVAIEPTPVLSGDDTEPKTEFSKIKERLDAKERLVEKVAVKSTDSNGLSQTADAEPALLLRGSSADSHTSALELKPESEPAFKPEPALFRTVTDVEPRPAKDHTFLYTVMPAAAVLLVLLPGVYYALQHYIYPDLPALSRTLIEPATLTLTPPPAPEYPPTSILDAPSSEPAPAAGTTAQPHGTSTNLIPHAVHMEAEAARAEADTSNSVQ